MNCLVISDWQASVGGKICAKRVSTSWLTYNTTPARSLADLKKTLAVLLDNIMLRLGKLEAKVENIYNGTGGNLTNSTVTATPIATNSEKVNVAGGFVINFDCALFWLLWQRNICVRGWIGKLWREWLSFMVLGKRKVIFLSNVTQPLFLRPEKVFFRAGNCTGIIKSLWPTKGTNDKIIGTLFQYRNSQNVVEWVHCPLNSATSAQSTPGTLWDQTTSLDIIQIRLMFKLHDPFLLVFIDFSANSQMMNSGLLREPRFFFFFFFFILKHPSSPTCPGFWDSLSDAVFATSSSKIMVLMIKSNTKEEAFY